MKKHLRNLTLLGLLACLPVQAAPVFKTAVTASGETSAIILNKPANTQPGDLLVAALMLDRGKRIDVTAPSGWTLIRRSNSYKYVGMATYYRIAEPSEPASYSFSLDEKTKWAASISRITGADLEAPRDNSNRATGRKGNVVAASVTTRKDDTLVLAYYTNRRNATYTPDPSTTVRYDEPNQAGGLPSNMLATFEQAKAGATGNKIAIPSRSDRHWVGVQISIAPGEEAATDLSGFSITATGNPLAGDAVSLQITDAKAMDGSPLSGTVAVTATSNLDGSVFDHAVTFDNGEATISIALSTVAAHTLTATLAGVTNPQTQTVTVNRRPITLTADPKSKPQNDPDPELTYTLSAGTLLEDFPLNGQPARDSGEQAGLYTIRQGSLTVAANPNYAITFISSNFEIIPAADLSSFNVESAGDTIAGEAFTLNIFDAKNATGALLSGAVAATLTSSVDGSVLSEDILFTEGDAALSIALTTVAAHTLTVELDGVQDAKSLPITVNRRPITLTADADQSKNQDDPDPVLTYTLSAGSLIVGTSLSGHPARDPGETAGLYAIQQGSLTDANNPNYAITFVSADFEIIPIEEPPPPPPPPPTSGIWISATELAEQPTSGTPWQMLKQDADTYWGVPNLSDQEDKANIYTMSKALVYARTGTESYRTDVIEACMQAIGTEEGGRSLALSRNLAAFVIAADLVELPPEEDTLFCSWLRELLTQRMADGFSLTTCHEIRPNNWGTHAGASRAAIAAYLEDRDELDRVAQVFKGWLGDRSSYASFSYGALSWQADSARPVGINPSGATLQGYNVDGVLPDEQRLSGEFTWPPPQQGYVYESLQGALLQAVILHRAGYDVWNWEGRALLRAWNWLHNLADYPATGDDTWQPFIINCFYDADFPTSTVSLPGKNVARTCWTHSNLYVPPPPETNTPPVDTDLEYYPGDYSEDMVLGNSLPGTWRPFSADSPWNTPIPDAAPTHPDSEQIMGFANSRISNIRLAGIFLTPIWVVNSENALPAGTVSDPTQPMDLHWIHMNSPSIFDTWDQNDNEISDVPIPLAKGMFSQGTEDGQFVVIDPFKNVAYEMSRFFGLDYDQETSGYPDYSNRGSTEPACSTFNVWDLSENGTGNPFEGEKWWTRGGKGSGFPLIAGVLRPEEVLSGEIRHALAFSFEENRRSDDGTDQIMMFPPACRSDGKHIGTKYPIEGMLFQLDPSLTEADFDRWGLTPEVKVLARALQKYGMYLDNIGGDMALATQQLGATPAENRAAWDALIPGFYHTVTKIPSDQFRIVYTGEPTLR